MREILHRILFTIVALLTVGTAMADGIHVGYCDGQIATASTGTVTGIVGSNATIQEAAFITPEMLQAYTSCQITSIYCGLAEGLDAYPETITAWVRADKEGEDIASGTATPDGGWNTVMLDNAVNVGDYAETGLWIGFSFTQEKKMNVIALLAQDEPIENTGWIAKNDKWTNYSSKGVLPLEAIVEGEGLPQHDLAILSATASPRIVKIGNDVKLKLTIKNNALVTAENPVINYSLLDGTVVGSYTYYGTLAYREKTSLTIDIPTPSAVKDDMDATVDLDLVWADGTPDDYEADNKASVNFSFAKDVYYRKMLCEEGTGSWCGWCVRGLVGLKTMREEHPDRFIGIGVHDGDEYTVTEYDQWMGGQISGYPSCVINRDGNVYDPSYEELEAYYEEMDEVATADVEVSAKAEGDKLIISSSTTFAQNEEGTAYKMVYVVREDQCPITQHNYYSGGGYGEMGGFENEGSTVDILLDDIARGVYPSPEGETIDTPASIAKGTVIEHSLSVDAPAVLDPANTCIVAILVDAATGEVVNAATGDIDWTASGIVAVKADADAEAMFNVAGQRVNSNAKGLLITAGKKVMK